MERTTECKYRPHGAAVKVDHHPLVGVHVEGLGELHPLHQRPELRADEGAAGVAGVNMEPGSQLLINIIMTWNYVTREIYLALHTGPISSKRSKAQHPVVPRVVETKKG